MACSKAALVWGMLSRLGRQSSPRASKGAEPEVEEMLLSFCLLE